MLSSICAKRTRARILGALRPVAIEQPILQQEGLDRGAPKELERLVRDPAFALRALALDLSGKAVRDRTRCTKRVQVACARKVPVS